VARQLGGVTFQHLALKEETTTPSKWQAQITRSSGTMLQKKGHVIQDGFKRLMLCLPSEPYQLYYGVIKGDIFAGLFLR
jgi:hypothetical protein